VMLPYENKLDRRVLHSGGLLSSFERRADLPRASEEDSPLAALVLLGPQQVMAKTKEAGKKVGADD